MSAAPGANVDAILLRLQGWLERVARAPSPYAFPVSDYRERNQVDDPIIRQLGAMMVRNKTEPAVLQEMADVLGWHDAAARIRPSTRKSIRRGDFGEALASELLCLEGYHVPVRKLRYQVDPEQSLHGTDIVAFALDDGDVRDLHFVEGKLRTFKDLPAGVNAHDQLKHDRSAGYADTLMFIAERLRETDPPLYDAFRAYLRQRDQPRRGSSGIFLVWDGSVWDDDVLQRVHEVDDRIDPLDVRVVHVADLAAVIEAAYVTIDAEVFDDGS